MEWKVRFIDYPSQFKKMGSDIMDTVRTLLEHGDLMLRQQLRDFESHLAQFVGTRFAVGTSNCTDALHLSFRAAGIGPGDEVITVSHTFVATVAAIHHTGATPVLVDIGEDHNMSVELVRAAITPRTKAIVPVHLNGRLCDMEQLMTISEERGLLVIEDSAQALGGSFGGKRGGSFGLAGCFSFYPAKLLGAYGDGGAIVTNSEELAEKVTRLRDHGRTPDGDIAGWSFNCRLDNLQAALLDLKLKQLPEWIQRRRELARRYHSSLSGLRQLRLPPPPMNDGPYHDVFQNYEVEAQDRDRLVSYLKQQGIEILISWGGRGVHQFKALGLSHFYLPRTDQLFREVLMLPLHTELSDDQVDYVSRTIRAFYA
ncbi:MAG: DegT/DnrJ/EryC1/StrS family aminotransferase [Nitrospiraceae bacterium]